MIRWTRSPERRRLQMALLLLVVSGVIRPAHLDPPQVASDDATFPANQATDAA